MRPGGLQRKNGAGEPLRGMAGSGRVGGAKYAEAKPSMRGGKTLPKNEWLTQVARGVPRVGRRAVLFMRIRPVEREKVEFLPEFVGLPAQSNRLRWSMLYDDHHQ